jgi:O-antigen ligase
VNRLHDWGPGKTLPPQALGAVIAILFVGFWSIHPYDLSYEVEEHSADEAFVQFSTGNLSREIALPMLAGLSLALGAGTRIRQRRESSLLWVICSAYMVWAYISVIWSDNKILTLKRLVVLTLLLTIAVVLAGRSTLRQLAFISYVCCGLAFVVSLGCEFYFGTIRLGDPEYRFSGVMHANAQGMNLVVFILSGLALLSGAVRRYRILLLISITTALPFLILTKSRTATATCILVGLYYVFSRCRASLSAILLAFAGLVVASSLVVTNPTLSDVVQNGVLMGRQGEESIESLSNRLPLWRECLDYLIRDPILGYGYGTFWTPERVEQVSNNQGWSVPTAHNGYLDAALDLGLPGVVLYVSLLIGALFYWHRLYQRTGQPLYLYALCLLAWLVLTLITESFQFYHPFWPTFVVYVLIIKAVFGLPRRNIVNAQERLQGRTITALAQRRATVETNEI